MAHALTVTAAWMALAVLATIIAAHLRTSIALVEILVGVAAAALANHFLGPGIFGSDLECVRFIASMGAILLTFLAGAELDPVVLRRRWRPVLAVGMVGFLAPFLGCVALARFVLHWSGPASWLAGVALAATSVAVVYSVLIETGLNRTSFGKGLLGACFVNDIGSVVVLWLLFSPSAKKALVFVGVSAVVLAALPLLTRAITAFYGRKTAAVRTKWLVLVLTGLGALALWAGSEAVLPAYLAGMVLARTLHRDPHFLRRFRTLTVGFLTPFYFLRAGSLVSLPVLAGAPLVVLALLGTKLLVKTGALLPLLGRFHDVSRERWYTSLLMSTGLTFGTIAAIYGLNHGIITPGEYSLIVASVIGSAVVPTLIAGRFFLPTHLLPEAAVAGLEDPEVTGPATEPSEDAGTE